MLNTKPLLSRRGSLTGQLLLDSSVKLRGGPQRHVQHAIDARYSRPVDAATPTHGVLVIGLDPYRVPGPWDPRPVSDAIEMGIARFAEHGVDVESCLFGLDGSDDVETVVGAALRARPWEVVVVGGGVRKPDEQLELFETVVNLVRRHAPDAAIAFNSTPADTFDAAARWLD